MGASSGQKLGRLALLHTQHGCVIQGHLNVMTSTVVLAETPQILTVIPAKPYFEPFFFFLALRVNGGLTSLTQSIQAPVPSVILDAVK